MEMLEQIKKRVQEDADFSASLKAARNAEYLAMIDRGIAQLEAGKGQEHDLIEVG